MKKMLIITLFAALPVLAQEVAPVQPETDVPAQGENICQNGEGKECAQCEGQKGGAKKADQKRTQERKGVRRSGKQDGTCDKGGRGERTKKSTQRRGQGQGGSGSGKRGGKGGRGGRR